MGDADHQDDSRVEIQGNEYMRSLQRYPKELGAVLLILLFKLAIISLLPVTGDEAYFVKWSTHLSSGYYDHPPMAGWLIYLMGFISKDIVVYRLFSLFSTFILAYIIYLFAKKAASESKAVYLALIFLASPIDILMSLFTNDIPLVLFGSIGAYLFFTALEERTSKRALLAGIFLGLAFLSKYFAVILIFSLYLFALLSYGRKALKPVIVASLAILPFVLQNLYYNYQNCWNNVMFNFLIRPHTSYNPKMILLFMGMLLYLFTPWGLWMLRKGSFSKGKVLTLTLSVLTVALGLLLLVSLKNKVGLHWFLLFIPYMYLLFVYLDEERLKRLFKYNFLFTLMHGVILTAILLLPLSLFENKRFYNSLVYAVAPEKVCAQLQPYSDNELFTLGYTSASMLSYSCHRNLHMLFNTSKYGRMDDKLTDIKDLDKRTITLFHHKPISEKKLLKACETVTVEHFNVKKATFYLATCKNFDYARYKKHFLDTVHKHYYNVPSWLPKGKCYFEDLYYR